MAKLMALYWWIDRWRDSEAFKTLPLEAQGLHRELVTQVLRRGGSLPNDTGILQRATGAMPDEWRRAWPKVRKFWTVTDDAITPGPELRLYVSRFMRLPPLVARGRRPEVPLSVKRAVFARDGRACVLCGATERLELDHVIPWSHGGQHTIENLRVLCKPCNVRRGNLTRVEC
jgi:hypothetical protein